CYGCNRIYRTDWVYRANRFYWCYGCNRIYRTDWVYRANRTTGVTWDSC
ncbi:unnamed protein product, partial [marine sediment metagenome]